MAILMSQKLRIKLVSKLLAKLRRFLGANLLHKIKCLFLIQSIPISNYKKINNLLHTSN
jgi:hypothetical protein